MPLDVTRIRTQLKGFDFRGLFLNLGWDHPQTKSLAVTVEGRELCLSAIAHKRGMVAFLCPAPDGETIPLYPLRRKIEHQVAKSVHEHIVIFTDAGQTAQVWQWVKREAGRPTACREHTYHRSQPGDALIQKLQALEVTLEEEEKLTILDAAGKAKAAFDVDKITKRFYDRFQKEHATFLKFIKGIPSEDNRKWYASLMLNRLMFVYFIQKKGFLDGDPNYLRNRLQMMQARKGKDKFLSFYRHFLLRLFHDGLNAPLPTRSTELDTFLGTVPYLNGGLFDVHQLEEQNPEIAIPDQAFERLFAFFDGYQWHLDERPLRADNEINPDVLGYIFEKYVNQKQMGAYYTKEDITDYIGKNTIVPYLFDAAGKKCQIAFRPDSAIWRLLRDDPDRYIYPAVRHGVDLSLPKPVAAGLEDVAKRDTWNQSAADGFALPTETWREHVARRNRCAELRRKLAAGDVHCINDLVTLNLDIRQFAQDAIENCEGPELLRAFFHAISSVSVLDPTCGSGAFLFAALNILEPLYEACLGRMQAFLDESDRLGEKASPKKFDDFLKTLAQIGQHPNLRYFILKSIIITNLYGVDIMEEAVEICKLRLFLKLVAQVENVGQIEPLPDIDFNIRAGNTLVGFVSLEELRKALAGTFGFDKDEIARIVERTELADQAYERFRSMQTHFGMDASLFHWGKVELRHRLDDLGNELDSYLAGEFGVDPKNKNLFEQWRKSYQPFHWFAEFYGIMGDGGFNVIIGNPPYLERSKLGDLYTVRGYRTQRCRDIYSWVVERTTSLRRSGGRLGLIVPVSLASSASFDVLRDTLCPVSPFLWLAHFANRPGQLFVGAQNRLTILLSADSSASCETFSTRYHRWDASGGERAFLFATFRYVALGERGRRYQGLLPKVSDPLALSVISKIEHSKNLDEFLRKQSNYPVYWVRVPGYFCQFFLDPPKARPENGGPSRIRGEVNVVFLPNSDSQRVVHAALNSSAYYQFYCAYSDGRHINPSDVKDFPFDLGSLSKQIRSSLIQLSRKLEITMQKNTSFWRKSGLLIESVDSPATKPVLDEIDQVLAEHYGFTPEETDLIMNYDLKYRMGQDSDDDDEEEP